MTKRLQTTGERAAAVSSSGAAFRPGLLSATLALYILFLPVQVRSPIGVRVAPSDAFLALWVVLGLGELRFPRSAWSVWHAGLVGIMAIGMVNAALTIGDITAYAIVNKGIGFLLLLASYAVITTFAVDLERIRWMLRLFLLGVLFHTALGIVAFVGDLLLGVDLPGMNTYTGRLSGMLVDPNAFGGLLVCAFALHVATGGSPRPLLHGWLAGLGTILLPIGILLTYSRSAWLGLVGVLLVATLFQPGLLVRVAVVGSFAVVLTLAVLGPEYFETMIALAARPKQIGERVELASQAFEVFQQHPVLGVGVGGFWQLTGAGTHNTTLWFMTDFGIVGLAVFLGFIGWVGMRAVRGLHLAPPEERSLLVGLGLAHVALIGLSFGIEALYQRHWWLVMASIVAMHNALRREPGR